MNKRKLISRYAVFLLGIVIMSEPVLSYGYTIKQPKNLSFLHMEIF